MSSGKRCLSSSIALRTPSATASAFEPGAWKMATIDAAFPLNRPICL